MIRLLLRVGDNPELQEFSGDLIRIGRASMNDLVIADPRVSRLHARIGRAGDGIQVVDLKSGNGTRVNGEKIGSCRLRVGDALQIGPMRLLVVHVDVTPALRFRRKPRLLSPV